ncbi:Hypothetical predicted protein [Mytilus galloprovincialis]|uniref:EF-hand domain-containing protein n=2 Tax=Mytilus galloprovincialis TaxID=29158 RepID=A0A8B6FAA7_MYTGA|nr:Hypothetical predicted protein [Mytilus galloprovincialis]
MQDAEMSSAAVMPIFLPDSQGAPLTERPSVKNSGNRLRSGRNGPPSSLGSPSSVQSPNASLSSIEIEALMREKVRTKHQDIMQAFMTYDIENNGGVTKGEFRRVLESFCFPMTTEQYDAVVAKVEKNSNNTVKYGDFLNKFYGQHRPPTSQSRIGGFQKMMLPPSSAREINVDMIEKMLRDKISGNVKPVIKALQLFDYNRDGKIQRHEMRRVIENYCFKLNDQQFDKLWQRYDFHHTGMVNYKEFLHRLGIAVANQIRPLPDNAKGALVWQQQQGPQQSGKHFKQRRDDEMALQKMNFNQIELEFRNRMRVNHLNLKKIFLSFDRHLDGFINLDDLKSILIQFTIPMSDQLFTQLMERCGVRGSTKISWEAFLDKFQDAQSNGNGQTLPIKPAHKFFPIREGMKTIEVEDIWKLLYKHVQNHYPSLKQAFLEIDATRKGRITRKELRNIIEKFTFRLEDEQFKQLMLKLDPFHTNNISYHQFLELFEETDDLKEGHKWLKSTHRFNENTKPVVMAWETIEEILREKITENWKNVSGAIMDYDHRREGKIAASKMKKVIDLYVLPVSDSHFENMLSRCKDCVNGKVNYIEFLENIKVDVRPGDLIGLSHQITNGCDQRENDRLGEQVVRQYKNSKRERDRTGMMTADEVIIRLKDRMSQHQIQIRQSFLQFDKSGRGKVFKRHFREVLASYGMVMSDEQFQELTRMLGFENGSLSYTDFIQAFEDPRIQGPGEDIQRSGNHRVNPIRGDEEGMTADQVEAKLRQKLRENFANLRAAFYKFDDDHNGLINKRNFRRILDSFMCIMSESEFEILCKKLGISKNTKISYEEFLQRFEVRDTAEGHKWLNSVHRWNETLPTPEYTAENAFEALREKVHLQWRDIAKAFMSVDSSGRGIVTKRDLRELLFKFVLPMGPEEFKKLWKMYDDSGKGYITHHDLLAKMGVSEHFTPSDDVGTSTKIIDESKRTLLDHNETQLKKQERITLHQAQRTAFMPAEQVARQLRDKIRDNYNDFYSAFRKYDTKKKGSLSVSEIQQVLNDHNLFMNDEEFFRLMDSIGLRTNRSRLNYEEFLHAFEDGRKSSYGNRPTKIDIVENHGLSPQDAENRVRETVAQQTDVLGRAFGSFDKNGSNLIPAEDFRRILDIFVFKMTNQQWKHLLSKLQTTDNMINYALFLDQYNQTEQEDTEKWLAALQKSIRDQTPTLLMIDDLQDCIREAVQGHFYLLTQAFTDVDYAGIGAVTKEDFKNLFTKNIMRTSDEQFEKLWGSLPINDFGNLDYKEFLRRYAGDKPELKQSVQRPSSTMPRACPPSRAMSRSMTQLDFGRSGSRMQMSRARSRLSTPMINAETAENILKNTVFRNWKNIQRHCRNQDQQNTGTIKVEQLRDILIANGVDMPEEEFFDLMTKYDLKENGTFAYVEFLRHFILSLKPKEETNLMSRRKLPPTRASMSAGHTSNNFFDAMIRVRDCVLEHWKEMRRTFRNVDSGNTGIVDSLEFRQILRQFNVNLSEEEFFHLLSYYDKNLDGKVSYNDFIRAYLQHA